MASSLSSSSSLFLFRQTFFRKCFFTTAVQSVTSFSSPVPRRVRPPTTSSPVRGSYALGPIDKSSFLICHHHRWFGGTPAPQSSSTSPLEPHHKSDDASHHHDDHHDHDDHHHDSRSTYLREDGLVRSRLTTSDEFHWPSIEVHGGDTVVIVNGQKMVRGVDKPPMEILSCLSQSNIPMHGRSRMFTWTNHEFVLKAEFLFFWMPTFIIMSIAVPSYTLLYMVDEAVYTTMTVKVIGRQWHWVYEVESPPEESDDDTDDK